ncbi:zinc-dependent metalloprotease [Dysgonomonas sp. BGC7]|uniref:zinc-dependent metalloprotease n=1 Tax=Dysgonomonas sp. BGC7 TaxID=1658008 RepID=UPI000680065C|nr:zinc-dependent metalloprotease [Dysgonomonas sp. BGC7]MBD8387815.1 zinc-dependent metalloprotease [Dysgonomonas sp. BGC7]
MLKKNLILIIFLILGIVSSDAQIRNPFKKRKKEEKKEAVASPVKKPETTSVKKYSEIITKEAKTSLGFFSVHKVKDKYYFEIPDSIMGRDILVVNRISKAPVNRYKSLVGYPGDQIGENVIKFEKGPNNKIFIRNISYMEQAKDTLGMYLSVKNSNMQPIVAAFPIQTQKKDSVSKNQNTVIDITDFINGDNNIFFFDTYMKKGRGIGNYFADRSYIDTIKAFPINIEIKTTKTYAQAPPMGFPPQSAATFPNDPMTYELNSSLVLLPKEPMKPRLFDPRVAYFAVRYTDFDSNPQGIEYKSNITRWRLEPKEEDLQKYLNGELVEPKKPIVFYIDPATPKKWVPYLMAGVNDWQEAFKKAGFKNAIIGLEAPKDSTWSLEDARHSAIVYKPSDIPNASGPHVHDPRSGEIIETHINWYHNVMSLLRNWYLIQAGNVDKRAQKMQFDDELMGQLIRFVSSHEVGHTLGLRHNFGSSATVPVENLRDKEWVEANGHTPSIMDYARFNYVAQPEDNISEKGLFPRIGIYDEWSIEWGYRYLPQFATAEDEVPFSNKTIIEKLQSDKRYTFGTETDPDDPRNQSEDLGDNAMLASSYGIKNLKRIIPQIFDWTQEPNKGYENARTIYNEVVNQYSRYMGHVSKNVAGIYRTPVTREENKNALEFVPKATQKEAMLFLSDQLFATPEWLIDKALIGKALIDPVSSIGSAQKRVIDRLISKNTIDKMLRDEAYNGTTAYTANDMFTDLKKGIWGELTNGKNIDIYRRNLQKNYVNALIKITDDKTLQTNPFASASDAMAIARTQLTDLRQSLRNAITSSSGIKRSHLQDLSAQIEKALNTNK